MAQLADVTELEIRRDQVITKILEQLPDDALTRGPYPARDRRFTEITWTRGDGDRCELLARQRLRDEKVVEMSVYKNGRLEGVQWRWFPDGGAMERSPYRNGRMHGIVRRWNEDGRLVARFEMKDGSGVEREYYSNGTLRKEITHAEGLYDGWRVEMHDNGRVADLIHYRSGLAVGFACSFHEDGSLKFFSHLEKGERPHGPVVHVGTDGVAITAQYYVHGTPVESEEYMAAARGDPDLPPLREGGSFDVREVLPISYREVVAKHESLPAVEIPLDDSIEEGEGENLTPVRSESEE